MKFSALERLLFACVFVLTAGVCVGFLFGYRYSFDQQRLEQRGVLVLSGTMDKVQLSLDGRSRQVSLPYVDTGITPGVHALTLQKQGYSPFQTSVHINTTEATILPVELAPHLLTGQKQQFSAENNDSVLYLEQLGVVKHYASSGTLLLHAESTLPSEVYLPTQLRMRESEKLALTQVSQTQLLLSTENISFLYDELQNSWKQIILDDTDVLTVDQGMLLAYNPTIGSIRSINASTGRPEQLLLEQVQDIVPSMVTYADFQDSYHLFRKKDGTTFRLQPRWFTGPQIEALPAHDILDLGQSRYILTESGSVLTARDTMLLSNVERVFVQRDNVFFVQNSGAVFTPSDEGGLQFLNRFSSPVIGLYEHPGKLYNYVQTETGLYFCEQKKLRFCTQLASGNAHSKRGVNPAKHYIWYTDKDNILTLIPFFRAS